MIGGMAKTAKRHSFVEDTLFSVCDIILQYWFIVVDYVTRLASPITSRLFSRVPIAPKVAVRDIRANRIKLDFTPKLSSPFNVDEYEVEFRMVETDTSAQLAWQSIGTMHLSFRTVARLTPGTLYSFRVRAVNCKGASSWTEPVTATTKLDPKEGGAVHDTFTWTQSASDVCFVLQVPHGTSKRSLQLELQQQQLDVTLREGGGVRQLLQGTLPHPVKPFTAGSYWELVKDSHCTVLSITLEKAAPSVAPKFDFWRSCFRGLPEIDTHKIEGDPSAGDGGSQFIPGSSLNPAQMEHLGIH